VKIIGLYVHFFWRRAVFFFTLLRLANPAMVFLGGKRVLKYGVFSFSLGDGAVL
jgi:hypothetical protein